MTTNLSEERIDYLIRLGKYLEYQKVKREAQSLEKAREEVRKLVAASKRLKEQSKEAKKGHKNLRN